MVTDFIPLDTSLYLSAVCSQRNLSMPLCHKLPAKMHYYVVSCYRIYPDRLIWRGTISRRMDTSTAALPKGTPWATGGKEYTSALCWCCCYPACISWEVQKEALYELPCKRLPELWDSQQDGAASLLWLEGQLGAPVCPAHGYIILSYLTYQPYCKSPPWGNGRSQKQRPEIQKTPSVWNPFPLYVSMCCSALTWPLPMLSLPTTWLPQAPLRFIFASHKRPWAPLHSGQEIFLPHLAHGRSSGQPSSSDKDVWGIHIKQKKKSYLIPAMACVWRHRPNLWEIWQSLQSEGHNPYVWVRIHRCSRRPGSYWKSEFFTKYQVAA